MGLGKTLQTICIIAGDDFNRYFMKIIVYCFYKILIFYYADAKIMPRHLHPISNLFHQLQSALPHWQATGVLKLLNFASLQSSLFLTWVPLLSVLGTKLFLFYLLIVILFILYIIFILYFILILLNYIVYFITTTNKNMKFEKSI